MTPSFLRSFRPCGCGSDSGSLLRSSLFVLRFSFSKAKAAPVKKAAVKAAKAAPKTAAKAVRAAKVRVSWPAFELQPGGVLRLAFRMKQHKTLPAG